jgi:hypothetical protein
MKRTLLALGLIGAVVAAAAWAGKAPSEPACGDRGLLLRIAVPDGPQKAGEALPMKFSVTNTGPAEMLLSPNLLYALDEEPAIKKPVVGSGLFVICQTERGDFVKFKGGWVKASGPGTPLKAGEELKAYTLDLAKCFDLAPGKYEVQLLFTRDHSGFLDGASNRVKLIIQ